MDKARKLRGLFAKNDLIRAVGAHNGLTAKLVELNGFDAVWASSLEVSASHAVPDANVLTMTDYLNAATSMNDAVSIPVVVDVDQGYGNSVNVIRMVKKFEAAGIAGIIMEDKLFPKQNSLLADGKQELASIPEFVGKIMAAKNAQVSEEFMVIARVEALIAGWGQEEAMKRAKSYVGAGADAIMIHSKNKDPDEVVEFITNWKERVPLVVVPTTYYQFDEEEIKKYPSVKMVIYANHGIRSAVEAVDKTLKEIKDTGGIKTVSPKLIPVKQLFDLQGTREMKEAEKKFIKTGKEVKAIIPAAGDDSSVPSLKHLLQDRPLTMLDINGKSILQRTVEILNQAGVKDVDVIKGYKGEAINLEGIRAIENEEYSQKGIMNSMMKGFDDVDGGALIVFADIVFDKAIVDRLLTCEEDINIVVDTSYRTEEYDKAYDLVVTKRPPTKGKTILSCGSNPVVKIGGSVNRDEATHEFIGITYLSKKGVETFKREYESMKNSNSTVNGVQFDEADLSDFLQELINRGIKVDSMEISRGWKDVRTFDDYKQVSEMLAN